MKDLVEDIIRRKTEGRKSEVLYTQWRVAKDYLPEVLSVISHTFPHYSLHDKTHADAILNNIARVVGEKVLNQFTAIDLWLLLSASYCHDIGMSVFAGDKTKTFRSAEFINFIRDLQTDRKSTLYEHAKLFRIEDDKIYYGNNELNAANYESAKFLLAEFIRREHAARSYERISTDESYHLPGSSIPQRLIDLLGRICWAHTQSFAQVMTLPFSQVGIDEEDCHPRYVACLLRIGDLLDMDNNRFSDVLLRSLSNIPVDSLMHKKKHLAINNLRVDTSRIEISAVCEEYEVADLTNRWFQLLDEEVANQMKRWNDIVPSPEFGFLPTLGNLTVDLKNYDTIDGKFRPCFQIDSQKSIELLQGAGLYNEPYQCIRELLQNAVDATLLRVFLEHSKVQYGNDFTKICKEYPIQVRITKKKPKPAPDGAKEPDDKKIPDAKAGEPEAITWLVEIRDKGIGMSKEDLNYLINTGGSYKNKEKKRIVERMPEWMKPSGTFGIGFQSVFLITPKVCIRTRKLDREAALDVELFNPADAGDGRVLVKTIDQKIDYGTTISFEREGTKIPKKWSLTEDQRFANKMIHSFDFVEMDSMNVDLGEIMDEVVAFNRASQIPIRMWIDEDEMVQNDSEKVTFENYSPEVGLEFAIRPSNFSSRLFYRGQVIDYYYCPVKFLSLDVNIVCGNAKEILTLSRNSIKTSFRSELHQKIVHSVCKYIEETFDSFPEKQKPKVSMFVNYYEPHRAIGDDWKNYKLKLIERNTHEKIEKTINEILYFNTLIFPENIENQTDELEVLISDEDTLAFYFGEYDSESNDETDFIKYKAKELFPYITLQKFEHPTKRNRFQRILSKKRVANFFDDPKVWASYYMRRPFDHARELMPCCEKYKQLAINPDASIFRITCESTFDGFYREKYPVMICPYIKKMFDYLYSFPQCLEVSVTEKLIDLTYEHRADPSVTRESIEKAYQQFLDDTQEAVQQVNDERIKFGATWYD